jgi:hypothetical protein
MPRSRRRPVASDRRFRSNRPVADYGTNERWQHSGRMLEPTERRGILAARATEEHIIDIMVVRGILTPRQREAAFRFKLDYQSAALTVHVTSSYNPLSGGGDYAAGGRERSDAEEAAYQRWRNAVRALGLRFSGIVITAACHDLLPGPRDLILLQSGLERLAGLYRLAEGAAPG